MTDLSIEERLEAAHDAISEVLDHYHISFMVFDDELTGEPYIGYVPREDAQPEAQLH